jgi:hypothetical protein
MPFFLLGWDYVRIFWRANWYLAAVFFIAFMVLNVYFIYNWNLFSLLEKEDWKEIRSHLEARIYEKKRESRQSVRILINTYVVLADTGGLEKLSRYLEEEKSRFFLIFALELGIPYMIQDDTAALEAYFLRVVLNPKTRKKNWLRWNLAFARLAGGSGEGRGKAADELAELTVRTKEPVLLLLSAYLLDKLPEMRDDAEKLTIAARDTLRKKYTRPGWEKVSRRSKNNIAVLILSKLMDDAEKWLFGNEESNNDGRV